MDSPPTLDLKKTVNLPRTDFPMKANLPAAEPKMLAQWAEPGSMSGFARHAPGRPKYVLHDGPPYANGNIHLGTCVQQNPEGFHRQV